MTAILSKYRLQAAKVPFRATVKGLVQRLFSITGMEMGDPYKVTFEKVDQDKAYFSYIVEASSLFPDTINEQRSGSLLSNTYNRELKETQSIIFDHIDEVKRKLGLPSNLKLKPMPMSEAKAFYKRNKASRTALFRMSTSTAETKYIGPFYIENFELENGLKLTWAVCVSNPIDANYSSLKGYMEITGSPIAGKTGPFTKYPEITVGTIFAGFFGYNMTLYRFFEVIKRDENYVYIKELEKKVTQQGNVGEMEVMPIPGKYEEGTVYKAKIQEVGHNRPCIAMPGLERYDMAFVWDGKPVWEDHWD